MKSGKALAYNANKILKHLDRLDDFQKGNYTSPVLVDFDLTNVCNNKCPRCSGFANKNNITVSLEDAKELFQSLKNFLVLACPG